MAVCERRHVGAEYVDAVAARPMADAKFEPYFKALAERLPEKLDCRAV